MGRLQTDFCIARCLVSGTTLAVLTEGTIRTYLSGTGDKTAERPAGSDARAIALGNAGTAYVLGNGEVRRVDL